MLTDELPECSERLTALTPLVEGTSECEEQLGMKRMSTMCSSELAKLSNFLGGRGGLHRAAKLCGEQILRSPFTRRAEGG